MEDEVARWVEFGAILVATGAVVCCMFHFLLSMRWIHREMQMNEVLDSLKDPYMITEVKETKTTLDCSVGEFRRVTFT